MNLTFSHATPAEVPELAALHTAVADDFTRRYGQGFWSHQTTERGALNSLRYARVVIARRGKSIVGTLRLANKKPWAIDVNYFTPVKKAIYLTGMAVLPKLQRQGRSAAGCWSRPWQRPTPGRRRPFGSTRTMPKSAPAASTPNADSAKPPAWSTARIRSSILSCSLARFDPGRSWRGPISASIEACQPVFHGEKLSAIACAGNARPLWLLPWRKNPSQITLN